MKLNLEAKNLLAITALVGSLALLLNHAAMGGGDRDMLSWSLGLFIVAIAIWIWMRRDMTLDGGDDAASAAEAAADEAEALAGRSAKTEAARDDLTRINGIGPRYAEILNAAGVDSFGQVANMTTDELAGVFAAAEVNRPKSLGSWIEQAGYAARGDWAGLKALQDQQ